MEYQEYQRVRFLYHNSSNSFNKKKKPDLSIIEEAAKKVALVLNKGAIVVLESTVYPGVTEDFLIPILEKNSGLFHKQDFFVGYSPERINPGDRKNNLTSIKKVLGADKESTLKRIAKIYNSIIKAGVHKVSSIKVAEASKAIENAQRDINIAFINEVTMLTKKLKIDSNEVLEAAGTKWNFLNFKPGLVGGHCIGVDPYYLAEAGRKVKFKTEIILAGRKVNDNMPNYLLKNIKTEINIKAKILLLGLSFKENIGDIRNSKAIELAIKIKNNNYRLDCYDPNINKKELYSEYGLVMKKPKGKYNCIILAVAHEEFKNLKKNNILNFCHKKSFVVDIKGAWKKKLASVKNIKVWCL